MKVRQDAWSEEDDLLLAETVLRHIREGGTQLKAFDEVGDALNRTSAACGFRWNAVVRDKYEDAIKLAKRHRKERKRQMAQEAKPLSYSKPLQSVYQPTPSTPSRQPIADYMNEEKEITMQDVIQFLQQMNGKGHQESLLKQENEALKLEKQELAQKVEFLEDELKKIREEHKTIEEDYQSIIQIMNRARRMALLDEETDDRNAPAFRMDKNGNLEKIAK
ncbi:RsfA family transcriptional regulator [Evansella cellulosilytica]|uniref:Transcription factor, RsfA family n=1 Tax=Evansella cellulosilytica (strain ATCC 21833 / DSM 2522 / FERM P-1141 / JCM 9156 / N-4) TaxID=649639 RepID=E6TV92_EVAC2|nr:RsfA family transcriptional regulator [Evansella cellulosilytica]ADU29776.1 transcription factor, RsfA family [Evansella cellulosilytica DSM 2522]